MHPLLIFELLLILLFAPVPFPNHGSHAVEKLSPTQFYECACVNHRGIILPLWRKRTEAACLFIYLMCMTIRSSGRNTCVQTLYQLTVELLK